MDPKLSNLKLKPKTYKILLVSKIKMQNEEQDINSVSTESEVSHTSDEEITLEKDYTDFKYQKYP